MVSYHSRGGFFDSESLYLGSTSFYIRLTKYLKMHKFSIVDENGNRIKSPRQKSPRKKSPRKNPFECR